MHGKDVLFTTPEDRARFVKQIDTSPMLYWNTTDDNPPPFATRDYLANKGLNAKMLRDKGLTDKHRLHEIEGVSHSGGEYLPEGRRGTDVEILDVSRVMDALIDVLDSGWRAFHARGSTGGPDRPLPATSCHRFDS